MAVETISNVVLRLPRQPAELELEPREALLRRTVILRLAEGNRPLLRAHAAVALERVPAGACAALLGDQPIGRLFGEAGSKPGASSSTGRADASARRRATRGGAVHPVFERGYRIIGGSRPLAHVIERIPATIFEERT